MRYVKGMLLGFLLMTVSPVAWAGDLESPATPTDPGSAVYTLEDIYQRLESNTLATPRAGGFTEPTAAPAPTGRTLNEVYEKAIPTQVPRTGQALCYEGTGDGLQIDCDTVVGQDGKLQKGMPWPVPRFTDHGDGTVTDNMTGLMWVKEPHELDGNDDRLEWTPSLEFCDDLDFAEHTDWRLPNVRELQSLIDYGRINPSLPQPNPFLNIEHNRYWTSSFARDNSNPYYVDFGTGDMNRESMGSDNRVWPVRGGQ